MAAQPHDYYVPDKQVRAVAGDCTGDAAAYDIENSFFALRATSATVAGCITDAMPDTDVLDY